MSACEYAKVIRMKNLIFTHLNNLCIRCGCWMLPCRMVPDLRVGYLGNVIASLTLILFLSLCRSLPLFYSIDCQLEYFICNFEAFQLRSRQGIRDGNEAVLIKYQNETFMRCINFINKRCPCE